MNAASGTARTGITRYLGTGPDNHIPENPAPVSRRPIIGRPGGHLKDASGAAARPGCARSLTCPPARHGHGSYQGNRGC